MAQTYTRQSTFADGDTITAALFNDEYNQLVNAFAYSSSSASSTGHRHDGTAGQGGNIHTIGDLDFLNKIVVDSTNNRWGFYVEVSSAAVEQIRLQDGALLPVTDSDVDLGTSSLYFKDAYIDSITTTGNVAVGGNLTVTGTTTFNGGTITMGDAADDNVVFGADVNSNIIPNTDNTYDLGSSSQEWKDLYVDGVAYLDGINFNGTAITSTAAELNILDGVTSTAAELNILDGVTSTTAELNILDGVTATATELNLLDGVTSTTAELNILDGVTSTAAELNILDGVTSTTAELNILDGVTSTTAELNILDGVTATAAELNLLDGVTATTAELNILDGVTASATDINLIDGITNGTVIASKAIITDANKDISGGRNITITGELDAATLDISGDADIDGTLEADAITIGGVTLAETISDTVGAMVTSNTETGIAVTYDDTDNTLDFVIGTLNQNTTGNAATATALETARTIHGVSFDGTANIDLSEVIQDTVGAMVSSNTESGITVAYQDADGTLDFTVGTLNQNTTGNAATATALETARTIHGVSFDGTANIDLTEVVQDTVGAMFSSNTESGITVDYQDADGTIDLTVGTLNQNTTGNAATATALETARTIHGVSFDGTANIDLTEVVQDTVGAMFSSNTETGITATYQDSDGTIDLTVSGAAVTSVADADADTKIQVEESSDEDKIRFDIAGTEEMVMDASGIVINDGSNDRDFRIESNGDANMFFVDGTNDRIGIGTNTPLTAKVEINGNGELLRLDGTGGTARSIRFRGLSTSVPGFITVDGSFKLHCEDSGTHMEFHTADTERMRIDSSGNVGIGTSSPVRPLHIHGPTAGDIVFAMTNNSTGATTTDGFNIVVAGPSGDVDLRNRESSKLRMYTANKLALEIDSAGNINKYINQYSATSMTMADISSVNGVGGTNNSGGLLLMKRDTGNLRSISAAGSINASGNDYAEYMTKSDGCGEIAKGDVVGVDVNGKLTKIFNDAISFVIKSTDPSYVGGDTWLTENQCNPEHEEYINPKSEAYNTARASVDRIAFCGQVPVNITGSFNVGDYVYPQANGTDIEAVAKSNPTFEEYQLCVGKIWAIQEDGRPFVSVKIN